MVERPSDTQWQYQVSNALALTGRNSYTGVSISHRLPAALMDSAQTIVDHDSRTGQHCQSSTCHNRWGFSTHIFRARSSSPSHHFKHCAIHPASSTLRKSWYTALWSLTTASEPLVCGQSLAQTTCVGAICKISRTTWSKSARSGKRYEPLSLTNTSRLCSNESRSE